MWEPRRLTTLWASTACYRDRFTFTTTMTTQKKMIQQGAGRQQKEKKDLSINRKEGLWKKEEFRDLYKR
jgi:hypothetical protein